MSPPLRKLFGLLILVITIFGVSVQAFAAPASHTEECTPSGEIKRGGELRLARPEEPLTFDPTIPR